MSFAAQHASAYAQIAGKGAAVTFAKTTSAATYDPIADSGDPVSTSVPGVAMQVKGNPMVYSALGLTEEDAVTLLFAATTYGDAPSLGAVATWAGVARTVRSLAPVGPDGVWIVGRVVLAV